MVKYLLREKEGIFLQAKMNGNGNAEISYHQPGLQQ